MKHPFAFLAVACAFIVPSHLALALPPDLAPPPAAFGDAERDGTLLVTNDLREADFGGGLRLPVRWVYRSSNQATNAYGWDGFSLTMLEAKAVKKNEILYEVTLLCGKVIYFNKQPSGVTPAWKSNDLKWGGAEDLTNGKFTITSWDGWSLEYKDGRIKKLTTEDSRVLLWSYDSTDPRLVASVKESGHDPEVEIEISNDPVKMAGSSAVRGAYKLKVNGDAYTFKYASGTLQDILYPDGRKTQWRFENNGSSATEKRLTLTGPGGYWKSWVFLDENRMLKTDDIWSYLMTGGASSEDGVVYNRPTMERTRIATGEKQKIEYQAANSISIRTDVLGNVTKTYLYKTPGKLYDRAYKVERKVAGESDFVTTWRGTYDSASGDLIRAYDVADNETEYAYEHFPGVSEFFPPKQVSVTYPLGRTTMFERNSQGDAVKAINAAGVERRFEYDGRHRLTKIKNSSGDTLVRYVYGEKDQIVEIYDALNNKTSYEYAEHLGRPLLTKKTSAEGRVSEWVRDAQGRIVSAQSPSLATWIYTYSSTNIGIADKITDPLAGETEFIYNSRLVPISVVDPLGNSVEREYDDLNLVEEIKNSIGQITKLKYNANGNLVELIDPRLNQYSMRWAASGERKELKWPDGGMQEVSRDSEGRVVSYKPRGSDAEIINNWNESGEFASQTWVSGTFSGSTSFNRNAGGLITSHAATTMGVTVSGSIGYNLQGEVSSISQTIGALSRSASMTYNLRGDLQTITYPAGFTVEYVRNADGQVTAIKKDSATIATYSYDSAGRLVTRTLSNGVTSTYAYDGMDRVSAITVTSGTSVVWAERYGYDAAGRKSFVLTGTSGSVGNSFWLDAADQLRGAKYGATGADTGYGSATASTASTSTWTYDAAGNRQIAIVGSSTSTYSANNVNQYTSATGYSSLAYNSRGDLASYGSFNFSYDAGGNLIQFKTPLSTVKYYRDAFGNRAYKQPTSTSKLVFFNAGSRQLELYNINESVSISYIYEPGVNRILAQGGSGGLTFYHQDGHANVVMLTNSAGENFLNIAYDAWGNATAKTASGATTSISVIYRFLYAGAEWDSDEKLYHLRARAYSPALGRFLQNDPIGFAGGDYNLARYVNNSPVDWIDPFGLSTGSLSPSGALALAEIAAMEAGGATSPLAGAALTGMAVSAAVEGSGEEEEPTPDAPVPDPPVPPAPAPGIECPVTPPENPADSPGEGWEWRGKGAQGSKEGSWFNPGTGESLHPDLTHPDPIGPHWDYNRPGGGNGWRVPPGGGIMTPK